MVTLVIAVLMSCVLAQYSVQYALETDFFPEDASDLRHMWNELSTLRAENTQLKQIILAHGLPLAELLPQFAEAPERRRTAAN